MRLGAIPGCSTVTATAQIVLNRTIRSGYVSVFMGYGGSFYHGDVQVPAGSVASTVTVAMKNEYISNCIRVQSTVVDVRDGPQGAPDLAADCEHPDHPDVDLRVAR